VPDRGLAGSHEADEHRHHESSRCRPVVMQ
jgi:hypothetical protein